MKIRITGKSIWKAFKSMFSDGWVLLAIVILVGSHLMSFIPNYEFALLLGRVVAIGGWFIIFLGRVLEDSIRFH